MIAKIIVGIISGFLGSIGIGGGSVLIIYLTLFAGENQLKAQGINLIFFIPCALVGLIFHIKNKLIDFKKVLPLVLLGIVGVIVGFIINEHIDENIIRKIFGAFIILIASYQLFSMKKDKEKKKR